MLSVKTPNAPLLLCAGLLLVGSLFVGPTSVSAQAQSVELPQRIPAPFMSYQGAGWLERPERVAEEMPDAMVAMMALEDGDVTLCESSAILEYVEELHPEPTLLGKDPAARAAVRREELECLEYYARVMLPAAQQIFFRKPEERDQELMRTGRRIAAEQLDRLEARLAGHGAPFVQGPELTRADLTWLPFIELAARGEMPLDPSRTPALIAWRDRLRERPSYVQTYPPHWRK